MRSDSISDKMGASVRFARYPSSAAADLRAIFDSREKLVRRGDGTQPKSVVPLRPSPRTGWRKTSLILSAALLVLTIAGAGVFYLTAMTDGAKTDTSQPEPPQPSAALVRVPPVAEPDPQPIPDPTPAQPAPAAASVTPLMPATQPKPVERPRSTVTRRAAPEPYRGNPDCIGLGRRDRAQCMRPQVIAADQQMRASYARAVNSGVGSRMLNSYQSQWTRLLRQTDSDPHHVTSVLKRMARDLDEESTR